MGALALLVLDQGCQVTGSDVKDSAMVQQLKSKGAVVTIGHSREALPAADVVVYSSAIKPDNEELAQARDKGIPILKRAQLLAQLMEDSIALTVAGAHGKTTTSAMIATMLSTAGLKPTVAVGGIINAQGSNAVLGEGRYFVAEVDESDGTFLLFAPKFSVITNIDFEHLDYYKTWDNILQAYRQFIDNTQEDGLIIACGDDHKLSFLLKDCGKNVLTYGLGEGNDIRAQNIQTISQNGFLTTFEVIEKDLELGQFTISVPGEHNVLNALACLALGRTLEIESSVIRQGLESFQGVKRRFDILGQPKGVLCVDDYGHHPSEIQATLRTARQVADGRVVIVFQPHRYSRTKCLFDELADSLQDCDELIVTDIYAAGETPDDSVSSLALCERIKEKGKADVLYLKKEELVNHLASQAKSGDLVLTLGAGDIRVVAEQLTKTLQGTEKTG